MVLAQRSTAMFGIFGQQYKTAQRCVNRVVETPSQIVGTPDAVDPGSSSRFNSISAQREHHFKRTKKIFA
jgi:hypothetical protein